MLLSETKATQQSHQEVWFGSAEHGSMRLQRHWSWLQLIKCFNVGREVRTRLCTVDLPIRSPNDLSRWRMDFRRTSSNTVSRWSWCAAGRPLRGPYAARTRPVAGRYAARGGPLRGRAATRPVFRAATRPMSSHGIYVAKAIYSNPAPSCLRFQVCTVCVSSAGSAPTFPLVYKYLLTYLLTSRV